MLKRVINSKSWKITDRDKLKINRRRDLKKYDTIIVGAGAAGLYCGCALSGGKNLILEKGKRPGLKLLMSGSGQCNVTHGGSIKEFLACYGDKGKSIRTCLQKHNNIELCQFLEKIGVPTMEREDGKIFPKSMKAQDILNALLENQHGEIIFEAEVIGVEYIGHDKGYHLETSAGEFTAKNLVIASGGASFPTTGSDGKLVKTVSASLGIPMEDLKPSLTPVFVENYCYGELSGISFRDVAIMVGGHRAVGDLLFTFKNFSGPVIINNSRYMKTGDVLEINFVWPRSRQELLAQMKKDFPGNSQSLFNYMSDALGLPKRFAKVVAEMTGLDCRKVSQLTGDEMKAVCALLTGQKFTVSGLAGFKEAMATAGGIKLSAVSTKTMESKDYPGLYFIGEVLDVDGDTGGYNLQFAYSSAMAAADSINAKTLEF